MTQILVNNIEQRQPDHRNDTEIVLFGRPAHDTDKVVRVIVRGFNPYFYVREDELRDEEDFVLSNDMVRAIDYDTDREALLGGDLAKVYTRYPQHVPEVAELFDEHWNADVPFTRRFRIDTDLHAYAEIPDDALTEEMEQEEIYEIHWEELKAVEPGSSGSKGGGNGPETTLQNTAPRVVTLDIEVDDRGDGFPDLGEERVLTIVAHDSYSDETAAFIDIHGRSAAEVGEMFGFEGDPSDNGLEDLGLDGVVDTLRIEPTERRMLTAFRTWFTHKNPDIVTGWNADEFDIPFLLERFANITGLNPDALARMEWAGVTSRGEPRIKGRTVYDLLTVYRANLFTEIRSYSLDHVAERELGEEKLEFEGTYYDLYRDDASKFLRYNARDVDLAVRINEEADVIEFRDILRREVGVSFEDSYNNKDFLDMMCRRELKEMGCVGPTRPDYGDEPDSDYEGAVVFDAYEGVAENVVGIDLASLYPYTMAMTNASPETKIDDPEEADEAVQASNGQWFTLDKDGLFKRMVDKAIALKSDYKEELLNADDPDEIEKWERKYGVAKTITNSIYGVTGWERFFLYDEAVASAVTLTGQTVIKRTKEYVENEGWDVIYGDTDSTYITFPSNWSRDQCLEESESLCESLNERIYPDLAASLGIPPEDNLWEIEVEVYMERFFQAGKKKRYAYLATWKDGSELAKPKIEISGFESKRSDTAELTAETEEEVFDAILHGDADEVSNIIYGAATEIVPRDPDWERIGIPGGLNKKITGVPEIGEKDSYYAVSQSGDHAYPQDAHPRAAYNANQLLDVNIGQGDKPMRVYVEEHHYGGSARPMDVIGFNSASDIEQSGIEFIVDVPRMLDTLLVRPFRRICSAIGIDVEAAVRGQEQKGLGAFE